MNLVPKRCRLLAAGIALSSGATAFADAPMFWSDSGIQGPPYAEIVTTHHRLALDHPGWAEYVEYGQSVGGRPLMLVKIQDPRFVGTTGRSAVVMSGSTHGNEYLNIEDRLPRWFLEARATSSGLRRFFDAGGIIYAVPILNPDGYERRERENLNGTDLNRDFDLIPEREVHFKEPETRQLAAFLAQDLVAFDSRLKLTIDYHCCDGSLLFPWAYANIPLPAAALAAHQAIGQAMQEIIDRSYQYGSTGQVLGYNPRGTSKDFYYAKYGTLAFTFEGSYAHENQNFAKHTVFWDRILGRLDAAPGVR